MATYYNAATGGTYATPSQMLPPLISTPSTVSPLSGICHAVYCGKAPKDLSSVDVGVFLAGPAAATITYAEIGVATGEFTSLSNATLQIKGFASIAVEAAIGTVTVYKKTISGLVIPKGTDLWAVAAASATTQPTYRVLPASDFNGICQTRAATRPSTNLNTDLAFSFSTSGTSSPSLYIEIP